MIYILLHACNNVLHYKNARDDFFWKGGGGIDLFTDVFICTSIIAFLS